jgi:UPF0755 protein
MIRRLLILLVLLLLLAGGAVFYVVGTPYAAFDQEAFVDIPPRTSARTMATMLARAGVIRSEWQFMVARALNSGAKLQAGEYQFTKPLTTWEVLQKIARGDVYYQELRIPEGANMFDIAATVQEQGFAKAADFLKVARDPSMIRDVAPDAPSLEGYLFPSTYKFTRRTSAERIARELTNHFKRVWKQIAKPGAEVNRTVTLASLVEKETAVPAERPTVASVYDNRLKIGMKLDCDPTTIYAAMLDGRWRGTIYRSDLDSTHPYNTYRNPGLPPGPIANPGMESLKAALAPKETNYLFFVAKGDGSGAHVFTENLAQHNAAVQNYRSNVTEP